MATQQTQVLGRALLTPAVALLFSAALTAAADAVGFCCRYNAATPAACGDAIDVPLIVLVELPGIHADVMLTPGANRSTQVPKFENDARVSVLSVAPTVIASGVAAGEKVHASADELPAATAYVTPAAVERVTAASSVASNEPPRLMLAAAGTLGFAFFWAVT